VKTLEKFKTIYHSRSKPVQQ